MAEPRVRRNGQHASCEPCRKSKIRCDHGKPHCARCVRRGLSEQCFYHPAPMSGLKRVVRSPPTPAQTLPSVATTPASVPASVSTSEAFDRATGLVGMHNSLMEIAEGDDVFTHRSHAAVTRTGVAAPSQPHQVTPASIIEGAAILELLLDWDIDAADLVTRYFAYFGEFLVQGPFIHEVVPAMLHILQPLKEDRSQTKLLEASRAIFEKTSKPFEFPPSAANGALSRALCDGTVRWETVGMYFISIGHFFASDLSITRSSDGQIYTTAQRLVMACTAWDMSMQCEAFCQRLGQVNDLTAFLLVAGCQLSAWCFGDNSYNTWRVLGTLSSVIYALDFHKDTGDDSSVPQYLIQLRKRALSLAFELDKCVATFVGRPPLFNRHYFSQELPLDLPNEALMGTPEDLEAAKANLDQNGWNLNGRFNTSSRSRVMLMLGTLREETLELSMGKSVPDLEQRVNHLLSELKQTWQSLPAHLRSETVQRDHLPATDLFCISFFRLEYLYTEFLLYKRLVSYGEKYRLSSVQTSHEVVNVVLAMVKRRSSLIFSRNDSQWAMVAFAMPCASVLLLELFHQRRQPTCQSILSKSTIIKDISAVIWCCDWLIETGEGNYDIIKQAQSIFSRGLDEVLDAPTESTVTPMSNAEPVDIDFGSLPLQSDEWNMWLETFGLQADAWVDFGEQAGVEFPISG